MGSSTGIAAPIIVSKIIAMFQLTALCDSEHHHHHQNDKIQCGTSAMPF